MFTDVSEEITVTIFRSMTVYWANSSTLTIEEALHGVTTQAVVTLNSDHRENLSDIPSQLFA